MTVYRGAAQVMRATAKTGLTVALTGSIHAQITTDLDQHGHVSVNSSRSRVQVTVRERDSYTRIVAARISIQLGGASHALTQG